MSFKRKINTQFILIIISTLVLVAAVGVTIWKDYILSNTASSSENTIQIKGTVTRKVTSCGMSTLREDGTIKIGAGICDAGESLTVDGVSIATSSGGPGVDGFSKNIDEIIPGDEVIAAYILNEDGRPSLDCSSCSVSVISHIDRTQSF